MENKHKLALYITYYLARFNEKALENLGYTNWNDAYSSIAKQLDIKKTSVRNRRDEFDPLFGYRAGWYQRPMSPSRIKVVQALENLDEPEIRELVKDILNRNIDQEEEEQLVNIISEEKKPKTDKKFILRMPTGKSAENFFIQQCELNKLPVQGNLIDCRDLGCGYDFKVESSDADYLFEVKGLAEISGGILLTDKEWKTACEAKENYILCLVKNVSTDPKIFFIKNPSEKFSPKRNMYTTIQISWGITDNILNNILEKEISAAE